MCVVDASMCAGASDGTNSSAIRVLIHSVVTAQRSATIRVNSSEDKLAVVR